jgi:AraC family transcriptional regulator, glycine betaine-responsive activator
MSDLNGEGRLFSFLLVDRFGMFSLAAAVDAIRIANRLSDKTFYTWNTVTPRGDITHASNGMAVKPDFAIADMPTPDILFVCASSFLDPPDKPKILNAIRAQGRRGGGLGAIVVGTVLLAEAGQLDGYRCTLHWENRAAFQDRFTDVECTGNVFEIDRKRYTCAGGTTALDLMLEIIRGDLGPDISNEVANQMQHERIRSGSDRQRVGRERDLSGRSEKLRKVVELMADNLEDPLTAGRLAKAVKLSVRQVERLFLKHLNMTPGRYYMGLRLERARELLRQTNQPILEVALATGFGSHSYFAQSYRAQFGRSPSDERRTAY